MTMYDEIDLPKADRTDETSRALEQKRKMIAQIQDMERKVESEQNGEGAIGSQNESDEESTARLR